MSSHHESHRHHENGTPSQPQSDGPSEPANREAGETYAERRQRREAAQRALLEQLAMGAVGPLTRLTETIDLTLDEVAEWISTPQNRDRITQLITLLDIQAQLLVSQQRLVAVARMVEVAAGEGPPETIRRACSDLLKLRLIDPYREDKRPYQPPVPRELDNEEVRAAFRELAERTERALGLGNNQQDDQQDNQHENPLNPEQR